MTSIAVVAHRDKMLGGGLSELRRLLIDNGVTDPLWFEVPKSAKAPKCIRKAVKGGADLVFVWGGDGMVQQCIDAVTGLNVTRGLFDWLRVLTRIASHDPDKSPMVTMTHGRKFSVRLDRSLRYELDGGARSKVAKLRVRVQPAAVCVCAPSHTAADRLATNR